VSADGPHAIHFLGFFSTPTYAIKKQIDEQIEPLYKLSWKYDHAQYSPDTLLYYLLERKEK